MIDPEFNVDGEKPVVLCIDDEAPVLSALERLLRREPFELITVKDPHKALEWVRACGVSLVITDQRMPSMSGTELLQAIRRCSPETDLLMLTAYPDLPALENWRDQGIRRIITKPWDEEDLKSAIRQALRLRRLREDLKGDSIYFEPAVPSPLEEDAAETLVRVDCAERTLGETLAGAEERLVPHEFGRRDIVIMLDGLGRLGGSLLRFCLEFLRLVGRLHLNASIIDPSGYFPAVLDLKGRPLGITVYGPKADRPPKRVLVVEDHRDSRDFLVTLIRSGTGHECDAVGTIEDAIRRLNAKRYDVVFLDLALPDGDGLSVIRHIRDRKMPIEVVPVSAYLEVVDSATWAQLGVTRRIAKPYRLKEIMDVLREP